jgi:hypothetical protein
MNDKRISMYYQRISDEQFLEYDYGPVSRYEALGASAC